MDNFVNENLPLFTGIFAAVCIIGVTLLIVGSAKSKAKKKDLLAGNPNLVELIFDEQPYTPKPVPVNYAGYLLYSVNGQRTEPIGRSLVLPVGETTLDVEYFMQQHGKSFPTSFGRSSYTFVTVPGKKYYMSFNCMDYCMMHNVK